MDKYDDLLKKDESKSNSKLFANKKANKILIIVGAIIFIAIIGVTIWANIPA